VKYSLAFQYFYLVHLYNWMQAFTASY